MYVESSEHTGSEIASPAAVAQAARAAQGRAGRWPRRRRLHQQRQQQPLAEPKQQWMSPDPIPGALQPPRLHRRPPLVCARWPASRGASLPRGWRRLGMRLLPPPHSQQRRHQGGGARYRRRQCTWPLAHQRAAQEHRGQHSRPVQAAQGPPPRLPPAPAQRRAGVALRRRSQRGSRRRPHRREGRRRRRSHLLPHQRRAVAPLRVP